MKNGGMAPNIRPFGLIGINHQNLFGTLGMNEHCRLQHTISNKHLTESRDRSSCGYIGHFAGAASDVEMGVFQWLLRVPTMLIQARCTCQKSRRILMAASSSVPWLILALQQVRGFALIRNELEILGNHQKQAHGMFLY